MDPDSILILKIVAASVIFMVGAAGAYSALKIQGSGRRKLLSIGNCIAGGVFIGAGLIHTLADSASLYSMLFPNLDFPVWAATAGLTVVLLLWIDNRLSSSSANDSASTFALFLVLSLHSVIAGMALGVEPHPAQSIALLVAILAHKGSAAFALGLRTAKEKYWLQMFGFALMTPIGVLFGAAMAETLKGNASLYFEAVFDSIAAGTFLYVALCEILPREMNQSRNSSALAGSALAGLLLMALLALYT